VTISLDVLVEHRIELEQTDCEHWTQS